MIRTRSRSKDGWRRAGVRHTPEPQDWPAGTFTTEQFEQMAADPELIVEVIADDPATSGGDSPSDAEPKADAAKPTSSRGKKS